MKWLLPGSLYELDGDVIYNTAVVISPEGEIVAKYRKMFPWLPYEAGTAAGNEFCVFDIPDVGRFGLMICYDMWFPEVTRTLVWMGAEVILQPTMTPTSDREVELVMAQASGQNVFGIGGRASAATNSVDRCPYRTRPTPAQEDDGNFCTRGDHVTTSTNGV